MSKIGTPRGFRDFGPEEMAGREYIFNTIKTVFRLYGYQPLETPAMELLTTLTGKYGEEGDKLMFRVLNSGDFLKEARENNVGMDDSAGLIRYIAEKGLRYDLTVPFARYVVEHYHELVFPFKRYQIQPVWRADRPQKGRYREFYQCDVDVIGSDSLYNEFELISIIQEVFARLGIAITIKLNNRKILTGLAEALKINDKFTALTVAIDKLEKAGLSAVMDELSATGLTHSALQEIENILVFSSESNEEKIEFIGNRVKDTESGMLGLKEIKEVLAYCQAGGRAIPLEIDFKLARGLNYYTGCIIEVKAKQVEIGSVCGGGRYDNLTGVFGLPGLSGVGISFGADRIYDVMKALELFPSSVGASVMVMLANFGDEELKHAFSLQNQLHQAGISAEIYPDSAKLKKQFSYASAKNIRFVLMAGKDEISKGTYALKDLSDGQQYYMTISEIISFILKKND